MLVLETLKNSNGKSVNELAESLGMSYMGAKQQCLNLEKLGYLKPWRVPRKEAGRPEKVYRLTSKCDILFPQAGVDLTLAMMENVRQVYGETAPEKLLYVHFENLWEKWKPGIIKGKSLVERATRLVDMRKKEGCFCSCVYEPEKGLTIEEYHNPMKEIFKKYPSAIQLETKLIEKLLATKVKRAEEKSTRGVSVVVYFIATL